jgi:hypothetical protein
MKDKNKKSAVPVTSGSGAHNLTLVLDLLGPYVVHFCKGVARIHAPLCPDHHANILTDSNDISLEGLDTPSKGKGFVYTFADPRAPQGAPKYQMQDSAHVLMLGCTMDSSLEDQCHLVFEVPYPDSVVGLHAESIWIHQNGAPTWVTNADRPMNLPPEKRDIVDSKRARGLRFIYKNCSDEPAIKQKSSNATASTVEYVLQATTLGMQPAHYQITLRFASNSSRPDDNHQDAYDCFQHIRAIVTATSTGNSQTTPPNNPGLLQWRVDFAEPNALMSTDNVTGHHPVDCGAAVLVVEDPQTAVRK